jgi:hypothetical protein
VRKHKTIDRHFKNAEQAYRCSDFGNAVISNVNYLLTRLVLLTAKSYIHLALILIPFLMAHSMPEEVNTTKGANYGFVV